MVMIAYDLLLELSFSLAGKYFTAISILMIYALKVRMLVKAGVFLLFSFLGRRSFSKSGTSFILLGLYFLYTLHVLCANPFPLCSIVPLRLSGSNPERSEDKIKPRTKRGL